MLRPYIIYPLLALCIITIVYCIYNLGYSNGSHAEAMKWQQSVLQIQKYNNLKLQQQSQQSLNLQDQYQKQEQQEQLNYGALKYELQNSQNQLSQCRFSAKFLQLANQSQNTPSNMHISTSTTISARESASVQTIPILTQQTESTILPIMMYNNETAQWYKLHFDACMNFVELERK